MCEGWSIVAIPSPQATRLQHQRKKRTLQSGQRAEILAGHESENMFFPLSILRIKIVRNGIRKRNMFLPVVLIWLTIAILLLLAAPLMILMAIFRPRPVRMMLKAIWRFLVFFSRTRGLHLEFNNERRSILIYHK